MVSLDVSKIKAILDKTEGLERRYSNGREYVTKKFVVSKVRVGDLVFQRHLSLLKMLVVFMFSNIGSLTSQKKFILVKFLVVTIYH